MHRYLLTAVLCGLLSAQQTTPPASTPTPPDQTEPIRVNVEYMSTPAWVYDRDGNTIDGLRPDQFRLFDNGKEQNINVDVSFTPISLVLCVQANEAAQYFLPQIKKIGVMIKPLLVGDQGEAAVITYHATVKRAQDFTNDGDKIIGALSNIYPGASSNRMIDAVYDGVRMLSHRPRNRQRIILLIGETRDVSSATRLRDALRDIELANVTFYAIDMSRFMTTLTKGPHVGRVDNRPAPLAGAAVLPSMVPATPTTVAQATGGSAGGGRAEFVPLFVELFRDAKAVFKDNPVEAFKEATGGAEYGFHDQRGLEEAVQKIGERMHSSYTISYSPNNRDAFGWHDIKVEITGRPDVKKVVTRPGYWIAPK